MEECDVVACCWFRGIACLVRVMLFDCGAMGWGMVSRVKLKKLKD
jgi:hypothetical protein